MGAATIEVLKQYSFDRAFLGSCGVDMVDCTVTTLGVEDGLTKKAVINSSRHKYVVMEKEKFYFNDSYKFAHFDDITECNRRVSGQYDREDAGGIRGQAGINAAK